jgi:hypothetical protein
LGAPKKNKFKLEAMIQVLVKPYIVRKLLGYFSVYARQLAGDVEGLHGK